MTYLFNDPADFATDAVRGLALSHPDHVAVVHGGVVRATQTPQGQPALVIGGGSGHYPAFAGWVGPGMAHGAPCGNVFASPSASQVYSVARNAENGGGVVLGFGNYAGDVLHFGAAAEKLRAEGIDVRIIRVSDDIVSNTPENHRDRRGIAGDLPVFKIAGAAIEAGADLDTAERIAWKANDATRSFGVAFDGCTLPGASEPLFHVEDGQMGVGLGIHGEPGVRDEAIGTADEIASLLVQGVLAEQPERTDGGYQGRAAVIVNGLGTVKYEELFVVYAKAAELLETAGITPVRPEVGEFITSLDMAGLSLSLVFLDDELEQHWLAPVDTPAFHRGAMPALDRPRRETFWEAGADETPQATEESRRVAEQVSDALALFERVCAREEAELGRIDAIAGDGDHGQGMAYGSKGAAAAARTALQDGAGARTLLVRAGEAWAESAGGTSGALWGGALTAAGGVFADDAGCTARTVVDALDAGIAAVLRLGGAKVGDKTMVDALVPFRARLSEAFTGDNASEAIIEAAATAREAADATADITATLGRARVLGDKSLGTPDPGAISFSILMTELGLHLG
ncbi:dihydroxyacetone kinase family protein [Brachybacterium alimentarium]|uniref:dihydroxyacetone kinase family protein n=2 Tax=Brachybacterium TaxID=43668 RepID=UPI000DF43782|nr:dihydroxyacetone kinase family protein [Brachybacterium alimentarium]RCS71687.1 DAK2 domain-containing protein [Brachybacterium alimentarium]RCS74402.1 DAK2 domain-containing protein [Brachybacterium alimentarium]RCS80307.1 DAK2 domain-containing protein [Brachybacterium alimentarium]